MVARTPRDVIVASKKLSSLLENRDLTAGAISGLVIKCPQNISFLKVNFSLNGIQTRNFK